MTLPSGNATGAPPPSGPPPRRLPLSVADLLLIVILALGGSRLVLPVLLAPFGIQPSAAGGGPGTGTIIALLAVQTAFLFAVLYAVAVQWRGVTWAELGFVEISRRWVWRSVAIALAAFPLVSFVSWVQMQLMGRPIENPQMDLLVPSSFQWPSYLGMLLVAGVLAPIVEELAFRGLLYRWLRERLGIWIAAVGSAVAFSVMHGIPGLIPAIAVLGLILAWIYEITGTIWAPIVVHGAYNAIVTTILYTAVSQGVQMPAGGG
jgi:hypothetical protein